MTAPLFSSRRGTAPARSARRVLVAGGAGFVGSHLSARLVAEGVNVVCADTLAGGTARIAPLLREPLFELVEHDVTRPMTLAGRIDAVVNLAAPAAAAAGAPHPDPVAAFRTTVCGTMALLDLAAAKGARFLQGSSSEVYGAAMIAPQPEDYHGEVDPGGPRAAFEEAPRAAETLVQEYRRARGVDTRIARIFDTYGPGMAPGGPGPLGRMLDRALIRGEIALPSGTRETVALAHVSDIVEGLARLLAAPPHAWRPVNLGHPDEMALDRLARIVAGATGAALRPVAETARNGPARRIVADITMAGRLLDWRPRVAPEAGLPPVIAGLAAGLGRMPEAARRAS